jgi:hypothetical protein
MEKTQKQLFSFMLKDFSTWILVSVNIFTIFYIISNDLSFNSVFLIYWFETAIIIYLGIFAQIIIKKEHFVANEEYLRNMNKTHIRKESRLASILLQLIWWSGVMTMILMFSIDKLGIRFDIDPLIPIILLYLASYATSTIFHFIKTKGLLSRGYDFGGAVLLQRVLAIIITLILGLFLPGSLYVLIITKSLFDVYISGAFAFSDQYEVVQTN